MARSRSRILEIIVPLAIVGIVGLLSVLGLAEGLELRAYDALLRLRPAIQEDPRIAILAIDDASLDLGGIFPWPRDITARGLLRLKDLGVERTVFDIEFLNPSPYGVNESVLNDNVPGKVTAGFREYQTYADQIIQALAAGMYMSTEAQYLLSELNIAGDDIAASLVDQVSALVQDNDTILAQSYRLFGKTYGTLNTKIPGNPEDPKFQEALAWVMEHGRIKTLSLAPGVRAPRLATLTPPIPQITMAASAMGYTNMDPDPDGVTRRVLLAGEYEGDHYVSLSVPAVLDMLGNPPLLHQGNRLVIQRSALDSTKSDIRIPLDTQGRMLINWTKQRYEDSFTIISFAELILLDRQEAALAQIIEELDLNGILSLHDNADIAKEWQRLAETREQALKDGDTELYTDFLTKKEGWLTEVGRLADGTLLTKLLAQIDASIAQASEAQVPLLNRSRSIINDNLSELQSSLLAYNERRTRLREALEGSTVIVGQTGTATTDVGVTPFESTYMNVAVHANVANTILQESFIQDLPPGYGVVISILFTVAIVLIARSQKPLPAALASFIALVVMTLVLTVIFISTGVYVGVAIPGIGVLGASISLTLLKFRATEKEKGFIRGAFARYLSDDVIKEIMVNPEALNLGGENKNMTAIFTDVKGFSSISEKLSPPDLVKLLNEYLSAMSNIILDSGGFIDKYEGDAIIAFWGAPLPYEDHAKRACMGAIRMRRIEGELNQRFMEAKMTPNPLLTRIGINTGEMVVGNMGTERRLNYTIMGNAVNLAARLEGVNKEYRTWILISQYTKEDAGDSILYRSLDRVRVVGINTPVRLYEVVEEKDVVPQTLVDTVGLFEQGLVLFEAREFAKAKDEFKKALEITPDDGPSSVFLERCLTYLKTPPKDTWDGVFNLTNK